MTKKLVLVKIVMFRCLGCPFEAESDELTKQHIQEVHNIQISTFASNQPSTPSSLSQKRPLSISRSDSRGSSKPRDDDLQVGMGLAKGLLLEDSGLSLMTVPRERTSSILALGGQVMDHGPLELEDDLAPNMKHGFTETSNLAPACTRTAQDVDKNRGRNPPSVGEGQHQADVSDLDFLCAFCDFKSSSRKFLHEHVSFHHEAPSPKRSRTSHESMPPEASDDLPVIKREPENQERYKCKLCEYQSDTDANLQMHITSLHFKAECKDLADSRELPKSSNCFAKKTDIGPWHT